MTKIQLYSGIFVRTGPDGAKKLVYVNGPDGKEFEVPNPEEGILCIGGRVTADQNGLVYKSPSGGFSNPIFYEEGGKLYACYGEGEIFDLNTKKYKAVPRKDPPAGTLRKNIVLPTIVTNAFGQDKPHYIPILAIGNAAMEIARATKGSDIFVMSSGWTHVKVGTMVIKCLKADIVCQCRVKGKGGPNT